MIVAAAASALLVAGPAHAAPTAFVAQSCPATPTSGTDATSTPASCEPAPSPEPTTSSDPTGSTTPTTTTSSAPSQGGSPGAGGGTSSGGSSSGPKPPNRPGRPAGDRDCADFATQKEAQQYFTSIGGSSTNNADRLDENHNGIACESLADDGDDQDASATSTGDDGSDATTSGNQVTEVPEGSAQTGGI
ncbi:excalibur calcium-binding domain-containing protein [Actinomycetospora endophytica]|uniref:Excalibur calcium-binding domain-containing protein n=1 Tax=Actinomycetospora endophytica TaxID=2291215 RepID=A0ABS8PHZ0_9PSEU|nr:excalibur calcium-binding domain-containing protein [Actinomycetospora endophytica]MCD2197875.1 excalibur calcium-binding domain-containing protein [Actinomycetospora endophytica]